MDTVRIVNTRNGAIKSMDNPKLKQQVDSRRTFAIISHPDAGKQPLQNNYYYSVARFAKLVQSKGKRLGISQSPTGWKLKNNGDLRYQFCYAV